MFVDSAQITVRAGRGGDGCVSFRRERFVPRGGPNGGDGGNGGSVVFQVHAGYNTLLHIQHQRIVRANPGSKGQGTNKTGAGAPDVVVFVPPGTIVRDAESGEMLGDLVTADETLVVANGGRGGRGNARFSTSTNRVPRKAEQGSAGEEKDLVLELKLLADLGLVGLPNAGKSTLLSRVSAARPKVADYPFTTLEPHLGVVAAPGDDFRTMVVADIPGIIEGASDGAGLGLRFLRHVERCRALAHLVDLADEQSISERVATIQAELEAFSEGFSSRPYLLVGTKLDAVPDRQAAVDALDDAARREGVSALAVSAATGEGLDRLLHALFDLTGEAEELQ